MTKTTINLLFQKITEENDQRAFNSLYKLLFVDLFRLAMSLTQSKETSEEIVNDNFMNIWDKRSQLSHVKDIKVYLFVSIKNSCLDYLRKKSRQKIQQLDDIEEFYIMLNADPEKLLITEELIAKVEDAVQNLPPRTKLVFILVKQYGLKYKEAATILNVSVKTVENQLAVAIKKISRTINFLLEIDTKN